jgi:sugar phosphate isomerase/epimerase
VLAPRFGWQRPPERADRQRLYRRIKRMGFDGLEWSPRWCDWDADVDAKVCILGQEVVESGLCVSAVNLNRFMLTRCAEAADHRVRLSRSVQIAPLLGASAVIISLSLPVRPGESRPTLIGQTVSEEELAETADVLRAAAREAAEQGVELVLELHDDGLLDTPELCLAMRERIGVPNVSINPDLGNLIRQERARQSWREALRQLAPHTRYWHIKNYRAGQATPIWDGDIDYAEALATMTAAAYEGWVSIESYFGDDVMQLQEHSLQWLRTVATQEVA